VGDPGDDRVGQHALQELEFAGAGLAEAARDAPDRAAVQVDPEVVGRQLLPVAQIALGVEEFGDPGDAFSDGSVGELGLCVVDESPTSPVEDAVDELGLLVVDQFQELDRQVVGGDEQRLGPLRGVVAVGRPSGLARLATCFDQLGGSKQCEVLTDGAR
jgi:hypothetical protein